jgi:organic radical activating enzyme
MSNAIQKFNALSAEIGKFVAPIRGRKVTDHASCALAIEAGKTVKDYLKRVEAQRQELVKPLNDEVKRINDFVKTITAPLLDAEDLLKDRIGRFQEEQERIIAAQKAKLEEERRKREEDLARQQEEERKKAEAKLSVASMFGLDEHEEEPPAPEQIEEKHIAEQADSRTR